MPDTDGDARPDSRVFYEAFNASPIGIVLENLEGRPLYVNPAFCSMLGYSEQELLQKHCVDFSPTQDAEKDWTLFRQLQSGAIERYHLDKRYFKRDGSLVWGRLSISLLNHRPSPIVVAMVEDITERKAFEQALQSAQHVISSISQRLIRAQEQERSAIGRELHDDVNQRLVLALLNVEAAASHLSPDAPLKRDLETAGAQLREVAEDIQTLSHRLHSAKLERLGLPEAAANFCREIAATHKVQIDFRSEGVPSGLAPEIALSLFRVLQEALQNAIKHSGATAMSASLDGVADAVQLTVSDAGRGFDPETAFRSEGIGLASMRERLRLVNGELLIDAAPGRGTTVSARVTVPTAVRAPGTRA